jgi:N-methylhydantoinase A/oxoprolinase/acetone carboxylase beta subunit
VVTLRVQAMARTLRAREKAAKLTRGDGGQGRLGPHQIFEEGQWRRGALYDRANLRPGDRIAGPAVIVELSATTYLPTAWTAAVDGFGNLVLAPKPARAGQGGRP